LNQTVKISKSKPNEILQPKRDNNKSTVI